MLTDVKLPADPPWWVWLPLVFVTISLFAAALALTPRLNVVQVNDLDAVAAFFRRRIAYGGRLVSIAGVSFALAIPAAFPVAVLLSRGEQPVQTKPTIRPALRITHGDAGNHSLAVAIDVTDVPQGGTATAEVRGWKGADNKLIMRHTGKPSAEGTVSASVDL